MTKTYLIVVLVQVVLYVIANQLPNTSVINEPYKFSVPQFKIYSGTATIKDRLLWLVVSAITCLLFPPTHITALIVAFVVNRIMK